MRAWTLVTNLQELRGHEEEFKTPREPPLSDTRTFGGENWLDRRTQRAYADRDPAVLVVGGGQAGLSIAARLQQLGIDTLIVDRHERVGDNWRKRYHSLTLHNEVHVNHLPYMPFPPNLPIYIPKDKLANWFEALRRGHGAEFLDRHRARRRLLRRGAKHWNVTLRRTDGSERVMHPRHLIFATGVSSIPVFSRSARARGLRGHGRAFRRLRRRRTMARQARRWCSAPAPAAMTWRRNCRRTAPTSR